MKSTGVIRRIDELGRVVLPKEIRRSQNIRKGDFLEIFVDDDRSVIFKKFSEIGNVISGFLPLVESFYRATELEILVTDTEKVLAAASDKKTYVDKPITPVLANFYNGRKSVCQDDKFLPVAFDVNKNYIRQCVAPIAKSGDVFGGVVVYAEREESLPLVRSTAEVLVNFIAALLYE